MSNQVQLFDFNKNQIRVVTIEGNPWFVARDVLAVFGLVNTTMALRPLDADESRPIPLNLIEGKGMNQAKLISESGLYKLVMRSDKPEARTFQDWVTKVVRPAIRKDGAYVMGEEKLATGEMSEDEFILRAMEMLKGKAERYKTERVTAR